MPALAPVLRPDDDESPSFAATEEDVVLVLVAVPILSKMLEVAVLSLVGQVGSSEARRTMMP